MNLRAVRSIDGALELLGLLGYQGVEPRAYDLSDLNWSGDAARLWRSAGSGFGVLVAEVDELPRSLRAFGRKLVDLFHDYPVAIVGIGPAGSWREFVIVRPRLVPGGAGAVSIAKLHVDPEAPTRHDTEVVNGLAWSASRSDAENHASIDGALDVGQVTRRFFLGLNSHFQRMADAVRALAEADPAAAAGIDNAGAGERVALRIVTQTIFCYFLQRKRLLGGNRSWLSDAYRRHLPREGLFYERVLEPLFYDTLAKPKADRPEGSEAPGIPFLNGGLFERHYGAVSLALEDELFALDEGLLGFLDGWSFTVTEDTADETEVAVDPEMLGKIFENLVADDDRRAQGTIYTPRPVVQFMCREALVPYLQQAAAVDENTARWLVTDDDPYAHITEAIGSTEAVRIAERVVTAIPMIRVIDPAVGSGAFPLGMLSELDRLNDLSFRVVQGRGLTTEELKTTKLQLIEQSLFGVDINPMAIELCRLRLWLSLLVDSLEGEEPDPLPNLEYQTVCADSLTDFVAGVEVQQTRDGIETLGLDAIDTKELVSLRSRYFGCADPDEKAALREDVRARENQLLAAVFTQARDRARDLEESGTEALQREGASTQEDLDELVRSFSSRDRIFPVFMPAFHAPEVAAEGGWDVVIMNPPYVGRKEVRDRLSPLRQRDLKRHYGRTADLMIHFGLRGIQLLKSGGILSMIANDAIFTGWDGNDFRRSLTGAGDFRVVLHVAARTKCFEGVAVNGGVIVASKDTQDDPEIRWVENYRRPTNDLLGASVPAASNGSPTTIGSSELFEVESGHYHRLPHRPLFRPGTEAVALLDTYEKCIKWQEFERYEAARNTLADWRMFSAETRLKKWLRDSHFLDDLGGESGFVLLGLVVEGGQGLATADNRRFLAAVEGTADAERALAMRERLVELTLAHAEAGPLLRQKLADGLAEEEALLDVALTFRPKELKWPRAGLIRVAPGAAVIDRALSDDELARGLSDPVKFVPYEKGDTTGEDGGTRWRRDNPLVVDWSRESVALLRRRAAQSGSGKAFLTNEHSWGKGGVTWNGVARYLRARLVPPGAIFGHMAPTIRPTVDWLSVDALLALLNAPVVEFIIRTFLGSIMHFETSDIRRVPIPLLEPNEEEDLADFGKRAVQAKFAQDQGEDTESLEAIERDLDLYVRDLYAVPRLAPLWLPR